MSHFRCVVPLALILALVSSTIAATITLKASPSIISPGHTPSLKLRCTISDSSSSSQPVVGRRDILHPNLRRQVDTDIAHVTSIVIVRTDHTTGVNDTIASVTTFDPPTGHLDLEKISVNGTTDSKTPGEKGYLELTWKNPSARQYGVYTCEVFALNNANHPNEVSETVQVGINEPSTQELLLYIADLEKRTSIIEQRLQNIQGGNVQTGTVDCTAGTHDYPIVFAKPFNKIPTTITALAGAQSGDAYVFTPAIINLTSSGFTLICTSYLTTSVVWVAL